MLNKTTIKIAVVTALVCLAFGWHVLDKQDAVIEARTNTEITLNAVWAKRVQAANLKTQKLSNELQTTIDNGKKSHDIQIRDLNTRLNYALSELRSRTERPANYTPHPDSVSTCSGAELYREDAEFLTREAARAERVLLERDYYYQQYEIIREKVNGATK